MGFPVGYSDLLLPRFFLHLLSFLSLIRKLISTYSRYLGLPYFLEPDVSWPHPPPVSPVHTPAAMLAKDTLPVVLFSDLILPGSSECCTVCLYEFEGEDEIRRLTNCRHIFHRGCVDRWMMGYHQMTCPLCRTPFLPDEMQEAFNQRFWAAEF